MIWKMNWPLFTGEGLQCYKPISAVTIFLVLISLLQLTDERNKQGIPKSRTKKLHRGESFTYVCCAKRNGTIWFRWGLYFQGSQRDPVPLYSRATVKGTDYSGNTWSRDLNASRYRNRVEVAYYPETLCMVWTILKVRKGDDNTFFGTFRDDQSLGKQFTPCNYTLKLVVLESIRPFSTATTPTPPYPNLETPPTKKESHTTTKHITDDDMEDTSDPVETPTEEPNNISDWAIPCAIISFVILVFGIVGSVKYRNEISKWYDSTRLKVRAKNAQEMVTKSAKRIRRRRR